MLSIGLFLMHLLGLKLASLGNMLPLCFMLLVMFKDGVQNQGCSCYHLSEVTECHFTLAGKINNSHLRHYISFQKYFD